MTLLILDDNNSFSEILFEKMKKINPGIAESGALRISLWDERLGS